MKYWDILNAGMLFCCLAVPARPEALIAARTIPSHQILTASDVIVQNETIRGTLSSPDQAVGLEARVVLYAGRPIRQGDVGPAASVERNQIVTLVYRRGSLLIAADARALGRGGPGDKLRVMNLSSRSTVTGTVGENGSVYVGQ